MTSLDGREHIDQQDVSDVVQDSTAKVAEFDAAIALTVRDYEAHLAEMFDLPSAELSALTVFDTDKFFAMLRAVHSARAAVIIRSFAFQRSAGTTDLLCAYLVGSSVSTGWSVVCSEVRLQRRAKRRLRKAAARQLISQTQRTEARASLRGRRVEIRRRLRGVARALLVALLLVASFAAVSASVGKAMTILLHSVWAGWLLGPVLGFLLVLFLFRPLLKSRLRRPLLVASRALMINLLALMVFEVDSTVRARLESFLAMDEQIV